MFFAFLEREMVVIHLAPINFLNINTFEKLCLNYFTKLCENYMWTHLQSHFSMHTL